MDYSPTRFALLHAIALADPDMCRGNTDSPVMTDLVNQYLVDGSPPYKLTPHGADLYREWCRLQRLNEIPGVTVHQARKLWRCVCADENTGYHIELTWPPNLVPQQRPRVTGRETFTVTGPAARQEAERMRRENPDATVSIVAIPNDRYRPDCAGDIAPGQMFALHANGRLCLVCAQAVLAERQVSA
jgi:hypothetical protein